LPTDAKQASLGIKLVFFYFKIETLKIKKWSVMQDSNLRPLGPKPSALPSCANHRRMLKELALSTDADIT
jgi:hypothetical protein